LSPSDKKEYSLSISQNPIDDSGISGKYSDKEESPVIDKSKSKEKRTSYSQDRSSSKRH